MAQLMVACNYQLADTIKGNPFAYLQGLIEVLYVRHTPQLIPNVQVQKSNQLYVTAPSQISPYKKFAGWVKYNTPPVAIATLSATFIKFLLVFSQSHKMIVLVLQIFLSFLISKTKIFFSSVFVLPDVSVFNRNNIHTLSLYIVHWCIMYIMSTMNSSQKISQYVVSKWLSVNRNGEL